MCDVNVSNAGDGAVATLEATVEGREMTSTRCYLGERSLPVAVFGADPDDHAELTYTVTVTFPELPLPPVSESRTVRVVD
jgi:hypothetical protein